MRELKALSDAVESALAKAERYRFLNEPGEAESICLDILQVDPPNQSAHVTLLLALTDQFGHAPGAHDRARETLAHLESEYDQAYYAGIIAERRAKAQFARGGAGSSVGVFDWIAEAMRHFERAEALRPPATTTPGCDGMPAPASSTGIRSCAPPPRTIGDRNARVADQGSRFREETRCVILLADHVVAPFFIATLAFPAPPNGRSSRRSTAGTGWRSPASRSAPRRAR